MEEKRVSVGRDKYKVTLTVLLTMDGLIASIVGGEKSHVGAIAISIPRPSLKDSSKLSTTTSVFTLPSHKDDELAKPVAERLAKGLNQTAVVVAGVHIEGASDEDVMKLMHNSMQAVELLLKKIRECTRLGGGSCRI